MNFNIKSYEKTITFFAAILMAFVSTCPAFADGNTNTDKKEDKEIDVRVGVVVGENSRNHHAPARIPIRISYLSFMSSLQITFLSNLGSLDVNVTNHSTGDYLDCTVDTSAGVVMLPISDDAGYYTITLTSDGGRTYIGEFVL